MGLVVPQHVGSSCWLKDRTHVPCVGRQSVNHWTARGVQSVAFCCPAWMTGSRKSVSHVLVVTLRCSSGNLSLPLHVWNSGWYDYDRSLFHSLGCVLWGCFQSDDIDPYSGSETVSPVVSFITSSVCFPCFSFCNLGWSQLTPQQHSMG